MKTSLFLQKIELTRFGINRLQIVVICAILHSLTISSSAKTQMSRVISPQITRMGGIKSVRAFEEHLKPFLESKAIKNKNSIHLTPDQIPTEYDFLILARIYKNLSPEFKSLYQKVTEIPDSSLVYESPRGHFEIYYFTSGSDSVDTTDKYGFDSLNNRINKPNHVPDYVDEVAWALDSAWSMEVDRFGFNAPIPIQDSIHASKRYKVIIEQQISGDYARTYVGPQKDDNSPGYSSYISLRNDWSGAEWIPFGYDKHPENGARVTCVHEFFHAIQYAMSRNVVGDVFLDDFPLTWTEGSAVLMEELGFSYINDYVQYSTAFFSDPLMQLFDRSENYVYSSSILLMYLYKFAHGTPSIDFVRDILFDNYQHQVTFQQAIYDASLKTGHSWSELLNGFHTASFFSGNRADTGIFLEDAALFNSWNYSNDSVDSYMTIDKPVNPTAMNTFTFNSNKFKQDSALFFLGPQESSDSLNSAWAASVILRSALKDSIVKLKIDKAGNCTFSLKRPNIFNELLFIITNGDFSAVKNYLITNITGPVTCKANETSDFKIASSDNKSSVGVTLNALNDLHYSLSLKEASNNSLMDSAKNHSLTPLSSLFEISYPSYWKNSAEISLKIKILNSDFQPKDSLSIYHWDPSSFQWNSIPATVDSSTNELNATIKGPGYYCVFKNYHDTILSNSVTISNFGQIGKDIGIRFLYNHNKITGIQIYSVDGRLVRTVTYPSDQTNQPDPNSFRWDLKDRSGEKVSPGLYFAVVKYNDQNMNLKTIKKKIILAP